MSGLGVEVAKNVILAGVKQVTLYDLKPTTFDDMCYQFNLTESDVGRGRAVVSVRKLVELNPHVNVKLLPEFSNGNITKLHCRCIN